MWTATDSLPAAGIEDDPFFEIVRSDPLLLRAEFDDLIDASWGNVPPSQAVISGGPQRPPRRSAGGARVEDVRVVDRGACSRHVHTAKRSPPLHR
jgi:hypothetical protein